MHKLLLMQYQYFIVGITCMYIASGDANGPTSPSELWGNVHAYRQCITDDMSVFDDIKTSCEDPFLYVVFKFCIHQQLLQWQEADEGTSRAPSWSWLPGRPYLQRSPRIR